VDNLITDLRTLSKALRDNRASAAYLDKVYGNPIKPGVLTKIFRLLGCGLGLVIVISLLKIRVVDIILSQFGIIGMLLRLALIGVCVWKAYDFCTFAINKFNTQKINKKERKFENEVAKQRKIYESSKKLILNNPLLSGEFLNSKAADTITGYLVNGITDNLQDAKKMYRQEYRQELVDDRHARNLQENTKVLQDIQIERREDHEELMDYIKEPLTGHNRFNWGFKKK